MRHDGEAGPGGGWLYKSDIKALIDQIFEQLVRPPGSQAPAELLDFLSSVCVAGSEGTLEATRRSRHG